MKIVSIFGKNAWAFKIVWACDVFALLVSVDTCVYLQFAQNSNFEKKIVEFSKKILEVFVEFWVKLARKPLLRVLMTWNSVARGRLLRALPLCPEGANASMQPR